ncbi:zinc-binding dehydrogenase [Rossellomorea vietnamensis]|uniref:Zinc-binding dehydrogenase n=1 Tax=Rossellomorea vietnamensis TaxID=218284 RepID=A0A6I6UJW0_9BACI|nr:zinc-binding alcohol dehydrogenase [Rossellomorea vietnamensis]QHE63285.1 zinc-binding dehydrogenase [Rossellomorea vietnamensis]
MRKIIAQNKRVEVVKDETPAVKSHFLLVKTLYSTISPGTELTIIENSTDKPITLGYSAMGVVEEVGSGITGVQKGDLVAVYGAPYVQHSEYLLVPKTLFAKVPPNVEAKEAALAGIGAIAIHALRIADLQFGETAVIVGLGLLGQMIAQIANAASYRVIAYDLHEERSTMVKEQANIRSFSSMEEMKQAIAESTNGNGADAVLLCAGGKRSPLTGQSLEWIRNKGKVVIVGDIEPDFPRNLMFSKEAQLLISRAGGPGRYDKVYEAEAVDYPYGFVRWTEGRNIEEYIRLVSEKRIDVSSFIKEEVNFSDVTEAFEALLNKNSTTLTKVINFSK